MECLHVYACQPILSHFKQENRIQLGQNPGRRTKPKKVDGEGAKMRSDIELFEARLAQVLFYLSVNSYIDLLRNAVPRVSTKYKIV